MKIKKILLVLTTVLILTLGFSAVVVAGWEVDPKPWSIQQVE